MVSMSFFMLLGILIIITLNSLSDKLFVSISSSSSSGEFFFVHLKEKEFSFISVSLSSDFGCSFVFSALVVKLIRS